MWALCLGGGGFTFYELGDRREAEGVQDATLDFGTKVIDLVHAFESSGSAHAIAKFAFAGGSFHDFQDRVGNFLRVARRSGQTGVYFVGNRGGFAVSAGARGV